MAESAAVLSGNVSRAYRRSALLRQLRLWRHGQLSLADSQYVQPLCWTAASWHSCRLLDTGAAAPRTIAPRTGSARNRPGW
jgi:hypothetical protein